jgi:tRNA modification GTPase
MSEPPIADRATAESRTEVVMLTPEGRGAVATLLVSGPRALAVVDLLFESATGHAVTTEPAGRILFGRWRTSGEELVVCRRGADRVEIHSHGGHAAPASVVRSLVEHGCTSLSWQDWLCESENDPIVASARLALAQATTERTVGILLDQVQGALRKAINELRQRLEQGNLAVGQSLVAALVERSNTGLHLIEPWKVVLAGRPNVGKSSLINALVGYQRAIVFDTPGTTRDILTTAAAIDGWPIELSDTAGLRASEDELELAGVRLAEQRLAAADLVVLVFDRSTPWNAESQALIAAHPNAVIVHNKCDLPAAADDRPPGILTSAASGAGLGELQCLLSSRLVPNVPPPGAAAPFTAQQVASLRELKSLLEVGDVARAKAIIDNDPVWQCRAQR